MAKTVHNDVLDAAFNEVKNNCNIMTVCSQQPADRTEAVTTYALADVAMASGDFTLADGDTSGRKMTVAAKSDVTVDATGTAAVIALCDATRLLYTTDETSGQSLTSGNTCDFPSWDAEIADPT